MKHYTLSLLRWELFIGIVLVIGLILLQAFLAFVFWLVELFTKSRIWLVELFTGGEK